MDNQHAECHVNGARAVKDLISASVILIAIFFFSLYFDILENFTKFSHRYEPLQLDEIIIVLVALSFAMFIFSTRRLQELKQEILARNRAEETLRRNEERFRLLIENASDIITVLDPQGTICYSSSSIAHVLGYSPAALIGENAFALIHPDDLPDVQQAFMHILLHPGATRAVELRLRHQEGSWLFFESIGSHFRDELGEAAIIVNSRCIHERKQVGQSLAERSKRLDVIRSISVEITRELLTRTLKT
jgi:PAS domain S-box-containing protein